MEYLVDLKTHSVYYQESSFHGALTASAAASSLALDARHGDDKASVLVEYRTVGSVQYAANMRATSNDRVVFSTRLDVNLADRKTLLLDIQSGRHITIDIQVFPSLDQDGRCDQWSTVKQV